MRKLIALGITLAVGLLTALPAALAQKDEALLREIAADNQRAIEALALYPQDAQMAILEAAKYPAVLMKMQSIHVKTSAAFQGLIEDFPRAKQELFFELARYPGLLGTLAETGGDPALIRFHLEVLPEAEREEAAGLVQRQMGIVRNLDELLQTSDKAFEDLILPYAAVSQRAFRKLLEMPEVIDILNEDLRFTVMVGDLYEDDPVWVLHKMDSLQLAVAREHAQELDNWKQTVENDPVAREEFIAATQVYSGVYYGDYMQYYGYPYQPVVVEYAYYAPYPYWFGYPWWHPYPRWRPYPYWYDWGFFYQGETFAIIFMPSPYFMQWYFDYPHHHQAYCHLSARFVEHYHGFRHSGTSITQSVADWRERNAGFIPDSWMEDKARLPERMREYGRFEEERQNYNGRNPGAKKSPEQFLEQNRRSYPELEKGRVEAVREQEQARTVQPVAPKPWAPEKAPVVREPEETRPPRAVNPADKPIPKPQEPPTPAKKKDPVMDAREYHEQQWKAEKQRQPEPPRTQPQPAPQTKQAPARKTEPARDPKKRGG